MSDIAVSQYEDYVEPLLPTDFVEVIQESVGGLRDEKQIPVTDLGTAGQSLTVDRIESKEILSGTISADGWYTIAETESSSNKIATADFSVALSGGSRVGSLSFKVAFSGGGQPKNYSRTTLEITKKTFYASLPSTQGVTRVRLAKSDSVVDAGAKIQVYCDVATTVAMITQITQNLAYITPGWELVTPYLDDTPTLPDGLTTGTFFEAGAEINFSGATNRFLPNMTGFSNSADSIFCCIEWPEIPKQGTNITLTLPSANMFVRDGDANTATLSGFTISSFNIEGKYIYFNINQTGSFGGLNTGPLMFLVSGTGGKLTIT